MKKVLYVELPEGAKYQTVEVTEDGRIGIVYTEECNNKEKTTKTKQTVSKALPKPTPLIGGTEVYQKEGTPYWYCKIKDGRDEFMYLYFGDLTNDDVRYTAEGKKRKFVTERQKKFRVDIIKALANMPEEGFRWIPVYEPSVDVDNNLQYVSGENVLMNFNSYRWEGTFLDYSPENGSKMATITTYFLLLLRLLKDGFATIEQLADDSKEIGHYYDSKNAKHDEPEKTGERQLGGLYGFVGNTSKIVTDSESSSGFSLLGGGYSYDGNEYPVADVCHVNSPNNCYDNVVGLLELTK